MIKISTIAALLTIITATASAYDAPSGAINPVITQANLKQTVCVPGYTDRIRPPVSYTNRIKLSMIEAGDRMQNFELDHYVPLSVGGAPTSLDNLWLQPWIGTTGARAKDAIETEVHRRMCKGELTLMQAQSIFINGWVQYRR
jgi:hypothetical protein